MGSVQDTKYEKALNFGEIRLPYDIIQLISKFCIVVKEQITQKEYDMIDYPCYGFIKSIEFHKGDCSLYFHTTPRPRCMNPKSVTIFCTYAADTIIIMLLSETKYLKHQFRDLVSGICTDEVLYII